MAKFLTEEGLSYFWNKVKNYISNKIDDSITDFHFEYNNNKVQLYTTKSPHNGLFTGAEFNVGSGIEIKNDLLKLQYNNKAYYSFELNIIPGSTIGGISFYYGQKPIYLDKDNEINIRYFGNNIYIVDITSNTNFNSVFYEINEEDLYLISSTNTIFYYKNETNFDKKFLVLFPSSDNPRSTYTYNITVEKEHISNALLSKISELDTKISNIQFGNY